MAMADTEPARTMPTVDQFTIDTEAEVTAERRLAHQVLLGALIAVPIGVIVCLGLVFIAVRVAGVPDGTPELMAVFVGALFGLFFGALSGFVRNTAALDELDLHHEAPAAPKTATRPHPPRRRSRILGRTAGRGTQDMATAQPGKTQG